MMFRGTKLFPPDKYSATLKEAGAASNAYTTDDRTVYHTTFSKPDLERILAMEADRFQNLEYSEPAFRTEALAVLGEYNKNNAAPLRKMDERLRETAFTTHTYHHTTMGFLTDVQDMPNQFAYSKVFFDRWYRPEHTTIIVVGDVTTAGTKALVDKHWGQWKRGTYSAAIPVEPAQTGPKEATVDWPTPTLPWIQVAFKKPAYDDMGIDNAALDLISFLGFSENSPLYRKLILEDQKSDTLFADTPDRVDPYLFSVTARVKKQEDVAGVREAILSTMANFKDTLVSQERLEQVKSHLRYDFALGMDNSQAIAAALASFVGLRRTPETVNRLYEAYSKVTPEDIRNVARKYFNENGRTVVVLVGGKQ
jgi:zinc protease